MGWYRQASAWLDTVFFPTFERVVTHRLFIVALLILGVVLMVDDNALLQLKGGNFTNVCSAVLGCVVLAQQLALRRAHQQHHEDHQARLDRLEARLPPPPEAVPPLKLVRGRKPRTPSPET